MENMDVNFSMEHVTLLIQLWEQGATTSAQEQELRGFFISSKHIPQAWEPYKVLFCGFAALSQEKVHGDYKPFNRRGNFLKTFTLYFAAAVIIAGVCLSVLLVSKPYCYINGKPIRNAELAMQATDRLSDLSRFDKPVEVLKNLENLSVQEDR